jgi:BMFP domain-containing protein YqiC
MRLLKWMTALAAVGALAAGTGAALAQSPEPADSRPPVDPAVACERAEHLLAKLQGLAERLSTRIAALEARIAGGELTPEQQARAEKLLEKLQHALRRIEARISKLEARIAEHCTAAPTA